jgi:hypothetical protein
MNEAELKVFVNEAIDSDKRFANELGEAIEKGTWEVVAALIEKAVGHVMNLTSEMMDSLKNLL